jgi:thymidylate synthase (FAD)
MTAGSSAIINCLDHGFVRLVDHMGNDLSIVRAARVSYDADWRTGESDGSDMKLLRYLWRNEHTSPFEAVAFTFEVKAPIFVLRQWHRHRTWVYNEVSARYTKLPDEFYVPDAEKIGTQSKNNKQARDLAETFKENHGVELMHYEGACHKAFSSYDYLSAKEWPRELARGVLPVSTYSRMFATVNLLNLLRFLKLRVHEHAQYEIRVYAEALEQLAKLVVPEAMKVWREDLEARAYKDVHIKELKTTLEKMLELFKNTPSLQGSDHVQLGIDVHKLLAQKV